MPTYNGQVQENEPSKETEKEGGKPEVHNIVNITVRACFKGEGMTSSQTLPNDELKWGPDRHLRERKTYIHRNM